VNILILAATANEVHYLKEKLSSSQQSHARRIIRYKYYNLTIDIVVSGIGMVAKAYLLGKYLQNENYDLALNVGIAGSFKKEFPLTSVVNVVQDQFTEMGAEDADSFIGIADMGFKEFNTHPYANGKIINNTNFDQFGLDDLKKVSGITSNTIHGRQSSISEIISSFDPDVETMGGAAFLYACLMEEIPCAQIRSISNYVEVRDRSKWQVKSAIDQLTHEILKIIESLRNN